MKKVYLGNLGGRIPGFNINLEVKKGAVHLSDEVREMLIDYLDGEGEPTVTINQSTGVATITFTPFSEQLITAIKSSLNVDVRIAILKRAHSQTSNRRTTRKINSIILPIPAHPLIEDGQTKNVHFSLGDTQFLGEQGNMGKLTEQKLRDGRFEISMRDLESTMGGSYRFDITQMCSDAKDNSLEGIPWRKYFYLGISVHNKGNSCCYLFTNLIYVI